MVRLALRNLIQNRARLVIAVGGTGLSLTLVLFFGAVFDGASRRLTAYIDHAGAEVWVSQSGVRTMHMSASTLPAAVTDEIRDVPGVGLAVPILYAQDMVTIGEAQSIAYVFGITPSPPLGGPWQIVEGLETLRPGEVILDRAIASNAGVGIGDYATVLGRQMRIAGLTSETSSLVSSVAFVTFDDFAAVRGGGDVVSYVLVSTSAGESAAAVAGRIAERVPGVTAQTSEEFADEERALVSDMSADIIRIMNAAGFLTGFAVLALTIYISTVARRREYGVLKAVGARGRRIYTIVGVQALILAGTGLGAGLALTLLLAFAIPRFNELLVLAVTFVSVVRVSIVATVLALVAALIPAWQVSRVEPMSVMRRGS